MPLVTRFYIDRSSPIHQMDARVKLIWVLVIFLAVMTFNHPLYHLAIFLSILAAAAAAKLPMRILFSRVKAIIPLGILIAAMWAIFGKEGVILWKWWVFQITDISLQYGISVGFRVISLVLALFVVLQSTEQAELLYGLIGLKMPYNFAFIITAIFRFAPTISGEADTIREAQRTRAMDFETGSSIERIRKSTSFLVPLIIRVLKTTLELSIALSSKAYGAYPTRTFHRQRPLDQSEKILVVALAGCELLFIIMRFAWGLGAVVPDSI
ncbi:MAG: energy-coupling factor transporter transmembrane protein EcfT [Anaerolineaceae bacterium]|nr:energy-coupling factor transporter transmembrane protein EcfT [Anaerolineaceae bacterium]